MCPRTELIQQVDAPNRGEKIHSGAAKSALKALPVTRALKQKEMANIHFKERFELLAELDLYNILQMSTAMNKDHKKAFMLNKWLATAMVTQIHFEYDNSSCRVMKMYAVLVKKM